MAKEMLSRYIKAFTDAGLHENSAIMMESFQSLFQLCKRLGVDNIVAGYVAEFEKCTERSHHLPRNVAFNCR